MTRYQTIYILFAIYVLALSRAEGFLGRIFETRTFRIFHEYVSRSIVLNVVLSFLTTALMVLGFGALSDTTGLLVASAWLGLSVWAFLTVARVVMIFLMMVGHQAGKPMGKLTGQTS